MQRIFDGLIDMTDYDGRPQEEKDNKFLTRALAAYSIQHFADVDSVKAADAITDGFDDNGIDAIYYDDQTKILWIVQSKWINSGNGCPGVADTKKFVDGIRDLINTRWERFNEITNAKSAIITKALDDINTSIRFIMAYTGQHLEAHPMRDITDLLAELNVPSELAKFIPFNLQEIHKAVAGLAEAESIEFDLALTEWGQVTEPYRAYYGTVNAVDIAILWNEYGQIGLI